MAAALILMVGLVLLSPLSLIKTLAQAAQGEQGTNTTATSTMVLLNINQIVIAIAKAQGVKVTLAEELYSVALI
jgi:serine protease inhibitor